MIVRTIVKFDILNMNINWLMNINLTYKIVRSGIVTKA